MKALSLTRPWGWVIVRLGKRIENRCTRSGRRPPVGSHRGPLYLQNALSEEMHCVHAWLEQQIGEDAAAQLDAAIVANDPLLQPQVIVARCNVIGCLAPGGCCAACGWPDDVGALAGSAGCADCNAWRGNPLDRRWHMDGQHGMLLDAVEETPLVRCPGKQGVWTVPADVLAQLGAAA